MFHGYTGDSGDWAEKLNYVGEGFPFNVDCRGQGGLSEDVGGVTGNTQTLVISSAVWMTL